MTGEDDNAVQLEVTKSESGEASALQRAEDAVIIAGNDIVMNAGINVVDNVISVSSQWIFILQYNEYDILLNLKSMNYI